MVITSSTLRSLRINQGSNSKMTGRENSVRENRGNFKLQENMITQVVDFLIFRMKKYFFFNHKIVGQIFIVF